MSKRDDVREIVQYIMTREGIVNTQVKDYLWAALWESNGGEKIPLMVNFLAAEDCEACRIEIGTALPINSEKVDFVACDKLNRKYRLAKFVITNNKENQLVISGQTFIYVTYKDIDACRDKFLRLFTSIGIIVDDVKKQLRQK